MSAIETAINTVKGSKIVTIVAETKPDWDAIKRTGPNPYRKTVKKRAVVNCMIGFIYESSVNRQRIREGLEPDFTAHPRKWGSRLQGTPWVFHNGQLYLETQVLNVLSVEYFDENGNIIDSALIEPFLAPDDDVPDDDVPDDDVPDDDVPDDIDGRQGVKKKVILKDYALVNIKELRMNGQVLAA